MLTSIWEYFFPSNTQVKVKISNPKNFSHSKRANFSRKDDQYIVIDSNEENSLKSQIYTLSQTIKKQNQKIMNLKKENMALKQIVKDLQVTRGGIGSSRISEILKDVEKSFEIEENENLDEEEEEEGEDSDNE